MWTSCEHSFSCVRWVCEWSNGGGFYHWVALHSVHWGHRTKYQWVQSNRPGVCSFLNFKVMQVEDEQIYCNSKKGFSTLDLPLFSFFTSVPVQRNSADWGGEAPSVQRRVNYSDTHASDKGKLSFSSETLSSVTPTSGLKSPHSRTGRGADAKED